MNGMLQFKCLQYGLNFLLFQVIITQGLCEKEGPCQPSLSSDCSIAREDTGRLQWDRALSKDVPVLDFPRSFSGQRRRKRDWVVPTINVAENGKGPFPNHITQIKSNRNVKMLYKITGPGADKPPIGRFTIDKNSGWFSVTEPLDREQQARYALFAHAEALGMGQAELPMEIIIKVIDMNDNKPHFTHDPFLGRVPEAAEIGFEFMKVNATDRDEPGQLSSDIRYSIRSQEPPLSSDLFFINPVTGGIQVASPGLDRETQQKYSLVVEAADNAGNGLMTTCTVLITVEDSNDNAPQFTQTMHSASVPENQMSAVVVKMAVTDADEPHSTAWRSRFRIVQGDNAGLFNVSTGPSGEEGIITTVTELDYESCSLFTLLVVVENEVVFSGPVSTSTATVTVTVEDRNEAPAFRPAERVISVSEDLPVDSDLVRYTATDPDLAMSQTIRYRIGRDPGGWLSINETTGQLLVRSPMDRESALVTDGRYTALILASDNGEVPATGTGTLVIELEDVNDNSPIIDQRYLTLCVHQPQSLELSVRDPDGPGFSQPFRAELLGTSQKHWSVQMNDTTYMTVTFALVETGVFLSMKTALRKGEYEVVLRVYDSQGSHQDSSLQVQVCDCTGIDISCHEKLAGFAMTETMGILGGVLALLLLLLLLLLFLRKRSSVKKNVLLQEDEVRDNIYHYDEEGGGEEDQDFDVSQLHLGLVNLPTVVTMAPSLSAESVDRPRLVDQQVIGEFIDDNLHAADADTTAPPYDCLLVFDYEGGAPWEGSLSSINSSSSEEDPDYQNLAHWGPRFSGLADMYTGGREEEEED